MQKILPIWKKIINLLQIFDKLSEALRKTRKQ